MVRSNVLKVHTYKKVECSERSNEQNGRMFWKVECKKCQTSSIPKARSNVLKGLMHLKVECPERSKVLKCRMSWKVECAKRSNVLKGLMEKMSNCSQTIQKPRTKVNYSKTQQIVYLHNIYTMYSWTFLFSFDLSRLDLFRTSTVWGGEGKTIKAQHSVMA